MMLGDYFFLDDFGVRLLPALDIGSKLLAIFYFLPVDCRIATDDPNLVLPFVLQICLSDRVI